MRKYAFVYAPLIRVRVTFQIPWLISTGFKRPIRFDSIEIDRRRPFRSRPRLATVHD